MQAFVQSMRLICRKRMGEIDAICEPVFIAVRIVCFNLLQRCGGSCVDSGNERMELDVHAD